MKIGIYDPYLDDWGGGEKYMMTMAQVLSSQHNVSVFWDNKDHFDLASKRFSLDLSKVKVVPNIFSKHISFIRRFKESRKYDKIIVLSDGSIPIISCELFLHMQHPLEHVKLSFFEKLKLKRVRNIFCNSEFTKSFIDKTFDLKADVLYPPVELHTQKIKKENIVLHVGRFRIYDKAVGARDYKKQYIMVDAFKEMVDRGLKKWKFVLCVNIKGEDQKEFEKIVESSKKYPIEFQVGKTNNELWEYYSKAKIYWHASGYGENLEKHPEMAEHFGISTVEAMGAGVVPVVIDAGGQKEIVTDGKDGLTWKTIPELKEETLILMNSKDLLNELSENAEKRARDFGIDVFKEKLNEILNT